MKKAITNTRAAVRALDTAIGSLPIEDDFRRKLIAEALRLEELITGMEIAQEDGKVIR